MIKSKSNTDFNTPIGEVKNFNAEDIKKETEFRRLKEEEKELHIKKLHEDIAEEDRRQKQNDDKKTVKSSSSQWSFCIFSRSETEETIDISLKPDFKKGKKK